MLRVFAAPPPPSLDRLLVRAGRAVQQATERAAGGVGIGATAVRVLAALAEHGPVGQRDLAACAGVTPATLTPVVDRLEAMGALTRERAEDRRVVQALLTPRGRDLLRAASAAVAAGVRERMPHPPDAAGLREFLLAVVETFEFDDDLAAASTTSPPRTGGGPVASRGCRCAGC